MRRFFVTGTDTNIGKTFISTVLAHGLRARYWKPIQTGTREGSDKDFACEWIGAERVVKESYTFAEPLSPHLASRAANDTISVEKCLSDYEKIQGPLVVEGAGGVLVPLNDQSLIVDLIASLQIPAIIVAGTKLGTINHTLLTIASLRTREIEVSGVITNGEANQDVSASIEHFGQTKVIGHVPSVSHLSHSILEQLFNELNLGV